MSARTAEPDDQLLVTMTAGALRQLVQECVQEAIAELHQPADTPLTVSGQELSQRLGVSRSTVHNMRSRGMPALKLGDCYRYEVDAVMQWLRAGNG